MVLINGIRLLEGTSQAPTGNFQHVLHLAQALASVGYLDFRLLTDSSSHALYAESVPESLLIRSAYSGTGLAAANTATLRAIRDFRPSIYHRPSGQLPFGAMRCKTIAGVPDLNFRVIRIPFHRRLYKEISFRWSFRVADRVICVSQFTRDHLINTYRLDESKVRVVHHGTNPFPAPTSADALAVPSPFFITFAHFPHKNADTVLRAHHRLLETSTRRVSIVVVGDNDYVKYQLEPLARSLGTRQNTRFLGTLSRAQLGWLYSHASGLLFMSRFEGFGLPILEAMGLGCPVIASNVCSIPEIAADAAVLLPPDDIESLASAMRRLLEDAAFTAALVERGRQRAARFSWERGAQAVLEIYRELDTN